MLDVGLNTHTYLWHHTPIINLSSTKLPFDLQHKNRLEIQTEGPVIQLLAYYKLLGAMYGSFQYPLPNSLNYL